VNSRGEIVANDEPVEAESRNATHFRKERALTKQRLRRKLSAHFVAAFAASK
jgi:hypothetical protein